MKKILFTTIISSLLIIGCKGKDEKKNETPATENTEAKTGDDAILSLDVTTLKDEAAFLKAWEDFTNARMADEKKKEANKNYEGHYLDYLKMYTRLLNASTEFSKTMQAADALKFNEKISMIQSKMYPTTK